MCGRGGEVSRGLAGNTTVMGNFTSVRQRYKHGGHVAGLRGSHSTTYVEGPYQLRPGAHASACSRNPVLSRTSGPRDSSGVQI